MIFARENCKPLSNPSAARLASELSRVKSSFANLTSSDGTFVQVAGGPGLFLLEYQNSSGHYRAFQNMPVASHPDGTTLECSAGSIPMARAEWFLQQQVAEVFRQFAEGQTWPPYVHWREVNQSWKES
jgi:hypothetical protein